MTQPATQPATQPTPQLTPAPERPATGAHRTGPKRRPPLAWLPWVALLALLALLALSLLAVRAVHDDGSTTAGSSGAGGAARSGTARHQVAAGALVGGGGTKAASAETSPVAQGTTAAGTVYGAVLFAEGSATLDAAARQVVEAAAQTLKASRAKAVAVEGYTDVVAGQPVNGALSRQRALNVAEALQQLLGGGVTVKATGRGEADPVASNSSDAGRAQNRRAVISATG